MNAEHIDVLVVGAGISGVCAGYHLQKSCPEKSYAILEGRERMGGTWDLFRYPGIRSDSDMYTLGFPFRPWTDSQSVASGDKILQYVKDTASEFGIDEKIRYNHRVVKANWDSETAVWHVSVKKKGVRKHLEFTTNFLIMCSGYYRYEQGYTPEFKGRDDFEGTIIHPQHWPEDFDYTDKEVIVIGSGATAMTLVPAMADKVKHITMLQRSPTYVISMPDQDPVAKALSKRLPDKLTFDITRWKNVITSMFFFELSQRRPKIVKRLLRAQAKSLLKDDFDVDTHFKPHYNPWDQRLCLVPNADLHKAINKNKADIVTDHIETFNKAGIKLKSGKQLDADVIITATGLDLVPFGGLDIRIDGDAVDIGNSLVYKGVMLSDVPNFASIQGYTNASWTLKADLSSEYICRILNHMDKHNLDWCLPSNKNPKVKPEMALNLNSNYILRVADLLPKQGNKMPWKVYQNYILDLIALRYFSMHDEAMQFSRLPAKVSDQGKSIIRSEAA